MFVLLGGEVWLVPGEAHCLVQSLSFFFYLLCCFLLFLFDSIVQDEFIRKLGWRLRGPDA